MDYRLETNASKVRNMRWEKPLVISGTDLTIKSVVHVARGGREVSISNDADLQASEDVIVEEVSQGKSIYGVTSGFGGMSDIIVCKEQAIKLQNNLVMYLKAGVGDYLPREVVRASMLARMNSHCRGVSGIRLELIQRIEVFLNNNVTPCVPSMGSIGASGDIVPLTYVTGAITGIHKDATCDFNGEYVDSHTALDRLGLRPTTLGVKEGLAMINGTAMMAGIGSIAIHDYTRMFKLALFCHAFYVQALQGSNQSFHPFIHAQKPHPGQRCVAAAMLKLLEGSTFIRDELNGEHEYRDGDLIQDRYSLRCIPQFMAPILQSYQSAHESIEVELNSATDNPLIDTKLKRTYHCGNFYGQMMATCMDNCRYVTGLMCQHLDSTIALLVTPAFNHGLPPALRGNEQNAVNMGMSGLQISGNSIVPLISFYGNSIADRFPSHADQFNQNINSQGFNAATLAIKQIELVRHYLAMNLLFAVQAMDMLSYARNNNYSPLEDMSPITRDVYVAVRKVCGSAASRDRPFVFDDRPLDHNIKQVSDDILCDDGDIMQAVNDFELNLDSFQ